MSGDQVIQVARQYPFRKEAFVITETLFPMAGDRRKTLAAGFDEGIRPPILPQRRAAGAEASVPGTWRRRAGMHAK